jgi:hypothetical protein
MSFCPKCDYALDITKNISKKKASKTRVKLFNMNKFISIVLQNLERLQTHMEDDNVVLDFNLNNLKNNNVFKKLKKDKKTIVIEYYEKLKDKDVPKFSAYFVCNNCGYFSPLKERTVLYSKNYGKIDISAETDYELVCSDNTLPRTKDYTCKNHKCITHDKKNYGMKEALWYRQTGSFQLTYVCCVCKTGWLI